MCNLQITRPFTVQTPTIRYHRMTHRIKSYEETLYSASTGVGPTDTTSPNPPPPSVTMPLTLFQLHQLSPPLLDDAASPRRRLLPSPCRWPLLSPLPAGGFSLLPAGGLSSPLSSRRRQRSRLGTRRRRLGTRRWIEKAETMVLAASGSSHAVASPRLPCCGGTPGMPPSCASPRRRPRCPICCRFVSIC